MDLSGSVRPRSAAIRAAAVLIALYGGLLRLDAFVGKYGPLDRPGWARVLTHDVAPLVHHLRPSSVQWWRESQPYVGGDPINYLAYAREMTTFYQPHVREPVFLAMTRGALWALDGQDAAVSLASAAGSMLAILAIYLLGAAVISPAGGLACAVILAIEYETITWAVDGWRDDTFMAFTVLTAWAIVRLRGQPSFGRAVVAGLLGGAACLTRITAISFIIPGLVWLVVDGPWPAVRGRLRVAATASLILAAVVAPYLISCALATGDPLLAVNYHTIYYRHAEGLPIGEQMSAVNYLAAKFSRRPFATFDTGAVGLFVQPFTSKWNGFVPWMAGLGQAFGIAALAGLGAWIFSATGRLLLVMMLASLLPYAFTWNLGGGAEWRFTMHAYPFFITAAVYALAGAVRVLMAVARDRHSVRRRVTGPLLVRVAAVLVAAALAGAGYFALPWFVTLESIASGESSSLETGPRDRIFYGAGWTPPHHDGITYRVSRAGRATVRVPLPAKRAYDLVLRIDPVTQAPGQRVAVLLNRQLVGRLTLTWNPERVGSYRITLPEKAVDAGHNELTLVPESVTAASAAGPRFDWIDPEDQIGIRLWYVRVLP
jgi:4-amino-4-deoxy-L-arabinose transferase-like glycosyltransferase